ncbi:hypothetical protein AJ80_08732 [Polytolypa hystricis UAMH7299]|uniref:Bul1 C-terminal domain-containing protein n=1 Tax=Polytolypa hystricis (strain UAMH7299) TaxID=1447883 RepID=A0A2B7X2Z9_POLH7|nr:hypothetical protein AJ80_08732 [Polytolypa hystricis UAMH7299]
MSRSMNTIDAMTRRGLPVVEIKLDDQESSSAINSYTTLDAIMGEVRLKADTECRFDQISIVLEGTSRTTIERPGVVGPGSGGRSTAFHTFLRLTQPIDPSQYPQPRIIEPGRTYTFPFTFVVPDRLLPYSCTHKHNHPHIHAAHTQLPPSLGDTLVASDGSALRDDMAPAMSQISYAVRVRVTRSNPADTTKQRTLVDRAKKIRIIPATDEEPPLTISASGVEDDYITRREKDVKKGSFMRSRVGRLVMSAAQPRAFRVSMTTSPDAGAQDMPTTKATVHLRFDPADENVQPPQLSTLGSKLKVTTFYATTPWADLPSKSSAQSWMASRGHYQETVALESRCVAGTTWQKHTSEDSTSAQQLSLSSSRRSSMQSTSTTDSAGPSAAYTGKTYYTTTLPVPISLPTARKSYVPSFHSCLTSRTYALDLCLTYHTAGTNLLSLPSVSLRVPVQVCSGESLAEAMQAREMSVAQLRSVADEFFVPRIVSPPQEEYLGQAASLMRRDIRRDSAGVVGDEEEEEEEEEEGPPEYTHLMRPQRLVAARVVRAEC